MEERTVRISWIDPVELIGHELKQLDEEGNPADEIQRQWHAVQAKKPRADELRSTAGQLLEQLHLRAQQSGETAEEPSLLEGIRSCWTHPATPAPFISPDLLRDKIAGGWFGRAAGCLLGKPVEKTPRAGIKELLQSNGTWPLRDYVTGAGIPEPLLKKYPWNRHEGRESLKENIVCMTEDDDMNYPMVNLSVLETAGKQFTTEDVASAWLSMLPVLSTFTAERVAYLNLLNGLTPPETARRNNPYREWIGAQIRGDVFGWVSPGDPLAAAEMAHRDARLSHVRNGIYGELFVAAMVAAAFTETEPRAIIEAGLRVVPPKSRLANAVRFVIALHAEERDWERAVDRLVEHVGSYHWVHTVNNAALVAAALLYGEGDYERSICNVVMGGWDADSNGDRWAQY
ncbi:MAG: ADP-ribosylglycohydrolase family protein, partial [Bacteroidetes bacterium]|nr:ADP-ribosylglycohydrolase family protein [Bacteroidota bacterium]